MKVLLCEDVNKIGFYGDIVEVSEGFARNYLLPQRLAIIPSEAKLRSMAQEKAKRTDDRLRLRKQLETACTAVNGKEAVIVAKANEQGVLFGSITPGQIVENLRAQGLDVKEEFVGTKEHIKTIGSHSIMLSYADDLTATITVTVVAEGHPQPVEQTPQPEQNQPPETQSSK